MSSDKVTCDTHGEAFSTFVCEHLLRGSGLEWYSAEPTDDNQWPDAWCEKCHTAYAKEGEWNEKSEVGVKITLLCHLCYERTKAKCQVQYV